MSPGKTFIHHVTTHFARGSVDQDLERLIRIDIGNTGTKHQQYSQHRALSV